MDNLETDRLLVVDPCTDSTVRAVVAKDELPATIDALPAAFVYNTHNGDIPESTVSRTILYRYNHGSLLRRFDDVL